MLQSIQKLAIAATFSAILAPAAFADEMGNEHTVMILGATFFPQVTYVVPGDVLKFVNATETEQSIVAQDAIWSVGPIPAQGEQQIVVSSDMVTNFNIVVASVEGEEPIEAPAAGSISFNAAPLSD